MVPREVSETCELWLTKGDLLQIELLVEQDTLPVECK